MADIQSTNAAAPAIIHRQDYSPPDWFVPEISLDFTLDPASTQVRATLSVTRNGAHERPLILDGDGLSPMEVQVDGRLLQGGEWMMKGDALVIPLPGDAHQIETLVELAPENNSKLMGLYASGGLLCTQCEAEGFRRITFFPDRPDILSRYSVCMEADQTRYPILLSNGDPVEQGSLPNGRHWARWNDPFPKPCYLFALVAGDLSCKADSFVTMSGRTVRLGIWVKEGDLPRTDHAMQALKNSMAWDERVYGREYDLDVFNIVAVADFNFGAMENKGLNIFNSRYILADPETATDIDYDGVEAVVAHEYFHNWSGNRVTCRDWFQLSLKEGFTVFRDQNFSADMGSHAVKRIEDVRVLRAAQFQEDSGPLAHPVRPESYIEISNFYTATIYNKGAELIRMIALMLGPDRFRAGSDLYFDRHDGQAATCEDFVKAMEEGGGIDLRQFRRWYEQAGTPHVRATLRHDPAAQTVELLLEQSIPPTPGQPDKQPMAIPLRTALFDRAVGRHRGETLLMLTQAQQSFTFSGFADAPILSINRGFSAPVIVEADRSQTELAFLSAHDDDPFARYEAMQQLMVNVLVGRVAGQNIDEGAVVAAIRDTATDPKLDPAFIAEAIRLPSEAYLGDQMAQVDPDAIHAARDALQQRIGQQLEPLWRDIHANMKANGFSLSPAAKGARKLRNIALLYLVASGTDDGPTMAFSQFDEADNMTERQSALATLANNISNEREAALDIFYNRYRSDALTLDKWFQTQAFASHPDTVDLVEELARHPDFTLSNPNRVRSLFGAFAGNQWAFHHKSGKGYRMVADCIIALDKINPQTAARLAPPLGRWRRFDEGRAVLMRAELQRILAEPGLSKDVAEQVGKSLN
ncbi:Aminopeptidase N [Sphingobium herbicidovorans NBRC 16415]|uniref:Aminopeptidase N n=1 Tax=Sphingobium herbicidovorans (strain ATCC 700291 / DSM 11019 / CCUG 56400 / KCTC 2939 / LMG 18315 / NBRC 16415 / MH) TaxID=1219045 RepID=A0A086P5B6_SPHHM|nr:aminopeptidase N [Sphingobium herbicidovorans]KFG88584.1 Aminopeptidase N [Sphingobium herbicidovorans NBRC 16415]